MKVLPLLLAVAIMQPLFAQEREVDVTSHQLTRNIEGSWELEVVSDPGPGAPPPFKALITFMQGGGVIETILLPPMIVPAHGEWVATGRNRYVFTVVHPILDATAAHTATIRATTNVRVTSMRALTATFEGTVFDPDGNALVPIKGTLTGKRITAD